MTNVFSSQGSVTIWVCEICGCAIAQNHGDPMDRTDQHYAWHRDNDQARGARQRDTFQGDQGPSG